MDSRPTRAVVLVAWTPLSPSPQAPGHARNLMQCAAGFIEFRSRISLVPTMTPRRPAALVSRAASSAADKSWPASTTRR
jgi:hypothetical protein